MASLSTLTIADARDMLRAGETTARQITEDCLAAIEDAGALNAFVTVTADKALAMAEAADQRRANGDDREGHEGIGDLADRHRPGVEESDVERAQEV